MRPPRRRHDLISHERLPSCEAFSLSPPYVFQSIVPLAARNSRRLISLQGGRAPARAGAEGRAKKFTT